MNFLAMGCYFTLFFISITNWSILIGEENRKGENSPPKRVAKIMLKLDKDQDGQLSAEEFIDGCLYDEVLRNLLAPNAC